MNESIVVTHSHLSTDDDVCSNCHEPVRGSHTNIRCDNYHGLFEVMLCDKCVVHAAKKLILSNV